MFNVSLGQPYSSPTSCPCPPACLAKVWASPSPPTTLAWVVRLRWEKPGKPHFPICRPESSTLCVTAKDPTGRTNYSAYAPRAAKSSCFTRQETDRAACNLCRLLLQRQRAVNTAQSCTHAQRGSKPPPSLAVPLTDAWTTSVLHFTKDIHPYVHSHMYVLFILQVPILWNGAFPSVAIPWTLI